MSLYLIINIGSLIIPFLYSFEKKMNFIQHWKAVFLAILIVAVPFLIWDIWFTKIGVWGFNSAYLLGYNIFNLPFEEVLFFICIPYASLFTHYALLYFFPKISLTKSITHVITFLLLLISIVLVFLNLDKWYTVINFLLFGLLMLFSILSKTKLLQQFYLTFLVVLIPFLIVNGLLTGSFIAEEVVWYNNAENLGIRLGTIPIEDVFYAFTMLFSSHLLIEWLKPKFKTSK